MSAEASSEARVLLCGAGPDEEALVRGALPGLALTAVRGEDATLFALSDDGPWEALLLCERGDPSPEWVFETLRAMRLDVAIVMLGVEGGEAAAVRAVKAGAGGFVSRESISRLREVLDGELADVGPRKQRREEARMARATEAFLGAVMDNVADGIVIWGDDGRIVAMNRAAEAFFGYRAEGHGELDRARLLGSSRHSKGGALATARELSGKRPDGSAFVGEATYGAMYEGSRRYEIVAVRDVTARRRLERALSAAQRFESLGAMAGELAHDLNTMLGSVIAYAELLADEDPRDAGSAEAEQDRAEDLAGLKAAARNASGLLQQLLAFARRQQLSPRRVPVRELVEGALRAVRPLLGASVRASLQCDDDVPALCADAGQLERVLVNLCVNARDAMPEGGAIEARARRTVVPAPGDERWPGAPPGLYAELSVRDGGTGIEPHVAERIFEPFVTSKAAGRGTGLGLAVVRGVVEQHGGMVEFESNKPDAGTTFRLLLPADEPERTAWAASREAAFGASRAAGRPLVLVAVEQPSVRRLLARELTAGGYAVRAAGDCDEVRRALEGDARDAALLMLDEALPGGTTVKSLLEWAHASGKRVPVLLLCDEAGLDEARAAIGDASAPVIPVSRHFAYADLEAQVRALSSPRGVA